MTLASSSPFHRNVRGWAYVNVFLLALLLLPLASCTRSPYDAPWWEVFDSQGVPCILLLPFTPVSLFLNYTDVWNRYHLLEMEIPRHAKASGSCNDDGKGQRQHLALSWSTDSASSTDQLMNKLVFYFEANHALDGRDAPWNLSSGVPPGKYAITRVTTLIHKTPLVFPNVRKPSKPFAMEQVQLVSFPTKLDHAFSCKSPLKIVSVWKGTPQFYLRLEDFRLEAFHFLEHQHLIIAEGNITGTDICKEDIQHAQDLALSLRQKEAIYIGAVVLVCLIVILVTGSMIVFSLKRLGFSADWCDRL